MAPPPFILPLLICAKCLHEWVPRKYDPRTCPNCRSVRWDDPR